MGSKRYTYRKAGESMVYDTLAANVTEPQSRTVGNCETSTVAEADAHTVNDSHAMQERSSRSCEPREGCAVGTWERATRPP